MGSEMCIRDRSIIVGGDFNVIFDQDLDGRGGNKKRKDSVRYVEDMIIVPYNVQSLDCFQPLAM